MTNEEIIGATKGAAGNIEALAGRMGGDGELEAKGRAKQAEGKVRQAAGKVQDAVGKVADHATDTIGQLSDRAQTLYSQASDRARGLYNQASQTVSRAGEQVAPMVRERPAVSLGVAAAAGFILGALLMGRGPKVVYLRDRERI